jgi:hypothetical protein
LWPGRDWILLETRYDFSASRKNRHENLQEKIPVLAFGCDYMAGQEGQGPWNGQ